MGVRWSKMGIDFSLLRLYNFHKTSSENRTNVRFKMKGEFTMTANEQELIKLIRENDNPEIALITAVETILIYLKQHESFEEQVSVGLRELA